MFGAYAFAQPYFGEESLPAAAGYAESSSRARSSGAATSGPAADGSGRDGAHTSGVPLSVPASAAESSSEAR